MQTLKKFYFGKSKVKPFVSTWKTDNLSAGSSTATQVKLPLVYNGSYNFVVEWGDGTQSTITTWNQVQVTKTYSVAGTYQITIKGKCIGWSFSTAGDRLKILSISQWGSLELGAGGSNYFWGCTNLDLSGVSDILKLPTSLRGAFANTFTNINRVNEWDTSKVTNMSEVFQGSTFNSNISNWNTSSVTTMAKMFQSNESFNQPIGSWNVSNVTDMSNMFQGDSNPMQFNQNIGSWNVGKVTNFSYFMGCGNAKHFFNNGGSPSINNWNTTSATNMSNMFYNAVDFNQPVSNWDTSKVTLMQATFSSWVSPMIFNNGLASGAAGNMLWNTSSVTSMAQMFKNAAHFNQNLGALNLPLCTNFTSMFQYANNFNNGGSADINSWNLATTGNITFSSMFNRATTFNQPIGSWNTAGVTNMNNMFNEAITFNQPIGSWNTGNVTDVREMFLFAAAFDQDIGSWNISNVGNFTSMFQYASKFNNGNSTDINNWVLATTVSINFTNMFFGAVLFNQPIGNWNTSRVTITSSMFQSATNFNNGLASGVAGNMLWNLQEATTVNNMFLNATSFNQNLGALTLPLCTNFTSMFNGASKFNNGGSTDMNNWALNTTGSILMNNMFSGASIFNQNIGSWNTSKVTSMTAMFASALAFDNGGSDSINNWNTANVTSMASMFSNCAFNQPVGNWNVSKVTTTQDMFRRILTVGSFNQDISSWNMSAVTNSSGMFANLLVFNNGLASGVAGNMLWNFENVTNSNTMFFGATSFNQNLGALNMSKNASFSDMFNGANKFNNGGSADINNWLLNTTGTLSLAGAFKNCTVFNQPLNNWNVSKVTSMNQTFNGAAAFDQNIGSWNVSSVTDFTNFMLGKTPATFSAANLDAIYNGWSSRPVKTPITISFGTAKHSTASSAGKDILIMTPNNWTIGDGGSTDGIANTYIGGIGSTINTPALLATKLGISTNRIENFSVTGSDVECIVIGGSYTGASNGFNNDSTITYFDDREGLITAFGYRFIRSAPNMLWVNFPNVTSLSDECFLGSHKLRELILPKLTAWTGGYCGCRIMNSLKVFKAPLLTTFNFTSSQEIFQSLPSLRTIIIPKQKSLGTSSLRESQVFSGSTLISGARLVIDPFVQTSDSGGLEGDVSFFLSNGGIVSFTYNENLPDPITDLSTVKIYNTSVQLNFTTPTAVNGLDFYEVYVNGKLNKEIKNSGEFITGLTPATNYNIIVVAVDVFYNKSAFSNAVNFTTTNKTATDTDAIAYINASSNSFYQDIIDDMFIGLKNQNLYTKILAFYPFLGTTQPQHKWNAKNPLDTNAAFRLQFFGGGTHSNLGYQCNGTNAYANSFFAVNLNANINSFGATIVCGTNNANSGSDVTEMGSTNPASATNMFRLAVRQSNTSKLSYFSSYNQANGAFFTNNVDCRGVFTGLRNSISENKLFINKTLKASGTGGGTAPTGGIYIGASNQSSSPFGYSNQRIQFTAIHEGLTDAEVVALHTIIDNFEAAIGRKTW